MPDVDVDPRDLIETIRQGLVVLDSDLNIRFVNRSFCDKFAVAPEDVVGRKIIVVANLAPRKLRGLESNGMLLAASIGEDGRPVLATFTEDVPNGARLK